MYKNKKIAVAVFLMCTLAVPIQGASMHGVSKRHRIAEQTLPAGHAVVSLQTHFPRALAGLIISYCEPCFKTEFEITPLRTAITHENGIRHEHAIQSTMQGFCPKPFWLLSRPYHVDNNRMEFIVACCMEKITHAYGPDLVFCVQDNGALTLRNSGGVPSWRPMPKNTNPNFAEKWQGVLLQNKLKNEKSGDLVVQHQDTACDIALVDYTAPHGGTIIKGCTYNVQDFAWLPLYRALKNAFDAYAPLSSL